MAVDLDILLKAEDQASGKIQGLGDALGGLGSIAAGVVTAGLAAAAASVAALGAGLGVTLAAAMENEKIQAALEQTIKSTGGAAGLTADAANALAEQFKNLAGGSDDAILAIETIGLRAGTISAEEMPNFIQSVLDLGTVMGDTTGAATLLARAQDDPLAAFKRIERATGAYDSALEEQIKMLQDSGDTAGAVALIMGELAETTGGAAAAQAETLSGQWEIFKGTLGEAAETIGMSLLPMAKDFFENVIAPAIPLVTTLAEAFADFIGTFASGDFEDPIGNLANLLYTVANALGLDGGGVFAAVIGLRQPFEEFISNLQTKGAEALTAIQPIIDAAKNLLAAFVESLPMIQTYFKDMVDFVLAQVDILAPTLIANITETLNNLAEFWREHGDTVMAVINFAFRVIATTIGGTLTLVTGLVSAGTALMTGDFDAAGTAISTTVETFMNSVLSIVGTDLDTFIADWTGVWELAVIIVTTTWENIKTAVNTKVMEMTGGIQQAIINTILWFQEIIPQFVAVGGAIIQAITDGVIAAAMGLINAVLGAVSGALAVVSGITGGGGGVSGGVSNSNITNTSNVNTNNFNIYGGGATDPDLARALAGAY